jgi:hypothetical protein
MYLAVRLNTGLSDPALAAQLVGAARAKPDRGWYDWRQRAHVTPPLPETPPLALTWWSSGSTPCEVSVRS